MIHEAVLKACDGLDGVKDGVIENPTACTFDYGSLACKGADASACLTAAQVESAKAIMSPLSIRQAGSPVRRAPLARHRARVGHPRRTEP